MRLWMQISVNDGAAAWMQIDASKTCTARNHNGRAPWGRLICISNDQFGHACLCDVGWDSSALARRSEHFNWTYSRLTLCVRNGALLTTVGWIKEARCESRRCTCWLRAHPGFTLAMVYQHFPLTASGILFVLKRTPCTIAVALGWQLWIGHSPNELINQVHSLFREDRIVEFV